MALTKDQEIIRRGLRANSEIIYPSDELLKTLTELGQHRIASTEYQIHAMKLEDALYDARKFLNYYYKLRKVPYLKIRKLLGLQIHTIREINPLELPINLLDADDVFSGSVTEIFIDRPPHIVFRKINISKVISEQTSSSYIHEITHTQLDSLKGSIREYYNLEILSIFNELFHSSILDKEERILKLNDSRRIHEMRVSAEELKDYHDGKIEMDREKLLDSCKYLISGLKAYNLFITFYFANEELQNDILDDIQAIFEGYQTLEELLTKYNITYENSQEPKRLFKYFNR